MLPAINDATLSRSLLSTSHAIRKLLAIGLTGAAATRMRETATVLARIAQQIDRTERPARDAGEEYRAVLAANRTIAQEISVDENLAVSRGIDQARIEAYLRAHPLGGARTNVSSARLLAGGRCKITALIEQTGAASLPPVLILRQDWDGGATDTTVASEFAVLERLHAHGVKVPRPLLVEHDERALGSAFIFVEKIDGALAGGFFDPPSDPALMRQLAEQLGHIHALPVAEFSTVLQTFDQDSSLRSTELASFVDNHQRFGVQSKIIEAALDWLAANTEFAGSTLSVVHNDVGFHNTLVDGAELTAVLDWELARIGHPASDLGYVKQFVERVMPWDEFLEHYVAAGGFEMPADVIRYHAIWNAIRVYGLIMISRHNLEIGRVNDFEITLACADNIMWLIAFIGREVLGDSCGMVSTSRVPIGRPRRGGEGA